MPKRSRPIPHASETQRWDDTKVAYEVQHAQGKRKAVLQALKKRRKLEHEETLRRTTNSQKALFARFSAAVYEDTPGSYMSKETEWTYMTEYSTETTGVWQKDDEVVISCRGTASARDMLIDMALIMGVERMTSRFRDAKTLVTDIQHKLKPKTLIFCGHSLGGTIALRLHHDFNGSMCYLYNPGITADYVPLLSDKGVQDFYVLGDPVSTLGQLARPRRVQLSKVGMNPHTIQQFI